MALNASERNIFADGILRCFGEDAHTAGRFLRFLNDVAGVSLLTNVQSRAAVYQPFIDSGLTISWWQGEVARIYNQTQTA